MMQVDECVESTFITTLIGKPLCALPSTLSSSKLPRWEPNSRQPRPSASASDTWCSSSTSIDEALVAPGEQVQAVDHRRAEIVEVRERVAQVARLRPRTRVRKSREAARASGAVARK